MRLHLLPVLLLSALTLAACGGEEVLDPVAQATGWHQAGATLALPDCENPGSLLADEAGFWASCPGNYDGNGRVVHVDLDRGETEGFSLGVAPGPMVWAGGHLVVGELGDFTGWQSGLAYVLDPDGQVVRGPEWPLEVCPGEFIGGMAGLADRALMSCFGSDTVRAFGVSDWEETERVVVGDGPGTLLDLEDGQVAVAESLGGTLSLLGTASGLAVDRSGLQVGDAPQGLARAGSRLLVANSWSNTLQAVELADGSTPWEVFLGEGSNPYDVVVVGNRAFVSLLRADAVAVVDLTLGAVLGEVPLPPGSAPQGLAVLADGRVAVALTWYDFVVYAPAREGSVAILEPAE